MQDELTTLMHVEFCQTEEEELELRSDGVYFDVFKHRKMTFQKALQVYEITESQFWENMPYKHVLDFPTTKFEDLKYAITKEMHERYKKCKNKLEICYLLEDIDRSIKT